MVSPGVALLPFVDERRLRAALEEVYPDLTPEESKSHIATWSMLSLCNIDFTFLYKMRLFFILFVQFLDKHRRHRLLFYFFVADINFAS